MEITHRARGSTSIINVHGRWVCGYDVRNDLRDHVQRLIGAGRLNVVLDLSGVTFADSTVVGEIASTHTALQRRGGRLTLLQPQQADVQAALDLPTGECHRGPAIGRFAG